MESKLLVANVLRLVAMDAGATVDYLGCKHVECGCTTGRVPSNKHWSCPHIAFICFIYTANGLITMAGSVGCFLSG